MSISVSLQDPLSYSTDLLFILLVAVIVPIIIIVLVRLILSKPPMKTQKKVKPAPVEKPASNMDRLRQKYLIKIDAVDRDYQDCKIDERESYIRLSSIVRNFVHEATGVNTQNLTLSEIERLSMPALHGLISVFYRPEFAYETGDIDVAASFNDARRVIREWN